MTPTSDRATARVTTRLSASLWSSRDPRDVRCIPKGWARRPVHCILRILSPNTGIEARGALHVPTDG